MDSSPDNFESLEKLLRLKRHEQPPPRYFNDFSGRVLSRIEAGEGRLSWWEKFGFDLRPAFAAAAGMAACVLVVYGVATTDGGGENSSFSGSALGSAAFAATPDQFKANSTNPVTPFGTPIDRKLFNAEVVPASFQH